MTVLVTGGTGFVGPKVVHALRARELPVRALVREQGRGRRLESWGVELAEGDVTDPASLRRAVAGCDAVVHLVGIIRGRPADFERVMKQATRDLVDAAREAGVRRFVLMSALGVDERTKDLVPYYGAKWEMERIVEGSGIEHVIFRPSFVFGRDGGLLPMLVRFVRLFPVTPIAGPGEQRIQPIWVDDVAEFFARAVDEPAAANRLFEVGGPDAVSWNELYARIKRTVGSRRPSVHIPMPLMRVQAMLTDWLPKAPVSRDQLKMLMAGDNTCDVRPALEVFKVPLVGLDEQLRRAV
jgi:NADH dehydrogenase